MDRLPTRFQNKAFTTSEFKKAGFSFYQLKRLVELGLVEQVSRGIYHAADVDLNEEEQARIAVLRVGQPAAICLLSALVYHNLTDQIPKRTWVMVPRSKRTQDKNLQLYRAADPQWKVGIEQNEGYSVTNLERTIIDCLTSRFRLGRRPGIEALRKALDEKRTTLKKLSDMAIQLGVHHRFIPYIQVLT